MLRIIATTLVLLTSGGLLACGGSRNASAASTTSRARAPITKAQARAFARAVNLRRPDVPGFGISHEHEREHETAAEKGLEGSLLRCAGGVGPSHQLAEAGSKEFEREASNGHQAVQSGVTVEQTPALAARDLAAVRSERGRRCLSHYINLLFKGKKYPGASVGPVSISAGSPPAAGTTGSFGMRITATIAVHGVRIPFYMDFLGFVYGPAEVTLFSFGVPKPFPAATEERLFSLLVERAKARPL